MMTWQKVFLGSALGVVLLDQFSKYWIARSGGSFLINQGISFGWLQTGLGLTGGVVVLVGVLVWLTFRHWQQSPLAYGLFFGGVKSNLLDRLCFGGVRDWLPIPLVGLYNNVADWAIAIAVIILLQQVISEKYRKKVTHNGRLHNSF